MPKLASRKQKEVEPVEPGRSERKRRAILEAATEVFLRDGYLGTNMDDIAALSEVSKQTVYKHFDSKEALFIEIVSSMTDATGDIVRDEVAELDERGDVAGYLLDFAYRQLTVVLTPRLMQLRRLVIGEVEPLSRAGQGALRTGTRAGDRRPGNPSAPGGSRSAGDRRSPAARPPTSTG